MLGALRGDNGRGQFAVQSSALNEDGAGASFAGEFESVLNVAGDDAILAAAQTAPLSHAAIVAGELGIPAVVGAGDASMRLRTGDRVRVDGGAGIVELLQSDFPPVSPR